MVTVVYNNHNKEDKDLKCIICSNCESVLTYKNNDLKKKTITSSADLLDYDETNYLVCPVCEWELPIS